LGIDRSQSGGRIEACSEALLRVTSKEESEDSKEAQPHFLKSKYRFSSESSESFFIHIDNQALSCHNSRMYISLVVAAAENNVIGDSQAPNHGIPWDLPNDMKHFRDITKGKPVIMGRKTLECIGRALPGRLNIVVTSQKSLPFEGVTVAASLAEALSIANHDEPEEICIIGGGEIYRQALPMADRLYLTRVHADVLGDTTFPSIDPKEWIELASERHEADAEHEYAYTFYTYDRAGK